MLKGGARSWAREYCNYSTTKSAGQLRHRGATRVIYSLRATRWKYNPSGQPHTQHLQYKSLRNVL